MTPVLILLRNNVTLSQACLKSVLAQDVPVLVWLLDNASTDGGNTARWAASMAQLHSNVMHTNCNTSVAGAWNIALRWLFNPWWYEGRPQPPRFDCALVLNNDTVLRPDTVRHLVADGGPFVTAVGSDDPEKIKPAFMAGGSYTDYQEVLGGSMVYPLPDPNKKRPHPDFSAWLIRRETWEKVGELEERFEGAFCEDADYHLRMHEAGIHAECLDLPFYHYGSATIKMSNPLDQKRIAERAAKNRALFKSLHGCEVGSPEYYSRFGHTAPVDAPKM